MNPISAPFKRHFKYETFWITTELNYSDYKVNLDIGGDRNYPLTHRKNSLSIVFVFAICHMWLVSLWTFLKLLNSFVSIRQRRCLWTLSKWVKVLRYYSRSCSSTITVWEIRELVQVGDVSTSGDRIGRTYSYHIFVTSQVRLPLKLGRFLTGRVWEF